MSRRPSVRPRSTRSRSRRRISGPRYLITLIVALAIVWGVGHFATDRSTEPSTDPGAVPPTAQPSGVATAPVQVPSSALTPAEALALVTALPDAVYTDDGSYAGNREELFGEAWAFDFDQNGCDTRNDILTRDLTGTV